MAPGSPTTAKGSTGKPGTTPTTAGKSGATVAPNVRRVRRCRPPSARRTAPSFNARCLEIWSHAGPDGEFWDAVDPDFGPYTIDDCTSELDPFWGEAFSDTVDEARLQGITDANSTVSDLTESGRLVNTAGYIYDIPQ